MIKATLPKNLNVLNAKISIKNCWAIINVLAKIKQTLRIKGNRHWISSYRHW